MSLGLLMLGFVIGMRHALEADHLAAMASLATRDRSVSFTLRQGAAWGAGHTLTLCLFGAVVLIMDAVMPELFAHVLELFVGFMLVALGVDVLQRMFRDRVHFHSHRHADGAVHFHAHSHADDNDHPDVHHHHHARSAFPLRALLVGMMHGMAGSAALILLTLQTVHSPLEGMLYIVLFGAGSIMGMTILSLVIAVPLHYSASGMTRVHNGLQGVIGLITMVFGAMIIWQVGIVGGLLT